jgi:hypothetical protein
MCNNSTDINVIDKVLNLAITVSSLIIAAIAVIGTLYGEEKRKNIPGNIWAKIYKKALNALFIFLLVNILIGISSYTSVVFDIKWLHNLMIYCFYLQMLLILLIAIMYKRTK